MRQHLILICQEQMYGIGYGTIISNTIVIQ